MDSERISWQIPQCWKYHFHMNHGETSKLGTWGYCDGKFPSFQSMIVDQTIEKVSFCAPDRNHEKGFAYICRDGTTRRWMCHGFMAVKESVSVSRFFSFLPPFQAAQHTWSMPPCLLMAPHNTQDSLLSSGLWAAVNVFCLETTPRFVWSAGRAGLTGRVTSPVYNCSWHMKIITHSTYFLTTALQ